MHGFIYSTTLDAHPSPYLISPPGPTGIEALRGLELIWVEGGVEVGHVVLVPPGFGGGELLVGLWCVELASTEEAACEKFRGQPLRERDGRRTGEWHRRARRACLALGACRDDRPRASVLRGRESSVCCPIGMLESRFVCPRCPTRSFPFNPGQRAMQLTISCHSRSPSPSPHSPLASFCPPESSSTSSSSGPYSSSSSPASARLFVSSLARPLPLSSSGTWPN